jgi:hypothetical protein
MSQKGDTNMMMREAYPDFCEFFVYIELLSEMSKRVSKERWKWILRVIMLRKHVFVGKRSVEEAQASVFKSLWTRRSLPRLISGPTCPIGHITRRRPRASLTSCSDKSIYILRWYIRQRAPVSTSFPKSNAVQVSTPQSHAIPPAHSPRQTQARIHLSH